MGHPDDRKQPTLSERVKCLDYIVSGLVLKAPGLIDRQEFNRRKTAQHERET